MGTPAPPVMLSGNASRGGLSGKRSVGERHVASSSAWYLRRIQEGEEAKGQTRDCPAFEWRRTHSFGSSPS